MTLCAALTALALIAIAVAARITERGADARHGDSLQGQESRHVSKLLTLNRCELQNIDLAQPLHCGCARLTNWCFGGVI
jgi:hypothetical protein